MLGRVIRHAIEAHPFVNGTQKMTWAWGTLYTTALFLKLLHYTSFALNTKETDPLVAFPGISLSKPENVPEFAQYPVCDVAFESTVCLFNQQHVLLPSARPYGIVGHYTFDMTQPVDSSGHKNHAMGATIAGSPFGASGASALFRKNHVLIPHSPSFEKTDYSITFWIYRLEDETSRSVAATSKPLENWCPILHKGIQQMSDSATSLEASPSILIDPSSGRIKVVISTNEVSAAQGEFFVGNFKLAPHLWNHIAVIRHLNRLRLYVNGILDATMKTLGTTRHNAMPFYVGATPWTQASCDLPFLMDELKIYTIPIGKESIQAEASPALAGIEPSSVFLSCNGCNRLQAEEGCPNNFHICTRIELLMGGYQVLRRLGLMSASPVEHIFTGETSPESAEFEDPSRAKEKPTIGIGLCCRDAV